MIDESHVKRLWISYNRRWRKSEPLDDEIPAERPQLMKGCFDLLLNSKIKTKTEILYDLPYSQRDIETLMNLPDGYLNEDFGGLHQLPTLKPRLQAAAPTDPAKVIQFEQKR